MKSERGDMIQRSPPESRGRECPTTSRREVLRLGAVGATGLAGCVTSTGDRRERLFLDSDPCEPTSDRTAGGAPGRFRCLGRPVEDFEGETTFEKLENWTVWGGSATLTDETAATGERSVYLEAGRGNERCGVVRRFDGGVDLSGLDLSLAARLEDPDNEGVIVQVRAPDRNNLVQSKRYCWSAGWLRLDHGPTRVVGEPDPTDVRELRIGMYRGKGAVGRMYVDSVRATTRRDRGAVAFTFDDIHVSQYETAFPLLRAFGYPGAAAVIPWRVGEDDRIGADGLREMHDAGWEIVSHPQVEDVPLPEMTREGVRTSIVESKEWLRDRGFESGARFVVWPFGQYDERSLAVAHEHHEMGFGTATSVVGRITDPLVVPRVNGGEPELAKRMVDLAERFSQVCVLVYHRITGRKRDIHATRAQLRDVLEHVEAADVDVYSVADLYGEFQSG